MCTHCGGGFICFSSFVVCLRVQVCSYVYCMRNMFMSEKYTYFCLCVCLCESAYACVVSERVQGLRVCDVSCCYCMCTLLFMCGFWEQCSPTLTFFRKKTCFWINTLLLLAGSTTDQFPYSISPSKSTTPLSGGKRVDIKWLIMHLLITKQTRKAEYCSDRSIMEFNFLYICVVYQRLQYSF